jgi:hypothetical protein
MAGAIYILAANRVHKLDVPFTQVLKAVSRWGSGSKDLVAAMARVAHAVSEDAIRALVLSMDLRSPSHRSARRPGRKQYSPPNVTQSALQAIVFKKRHPEAAVPYEVPRLIIRWIPNYTRHVRVARVHPANVRFAGRVIADVVSPRVLRKFRIVVQRTLRRGARPYRLDSGNDRKAVTCRSSRKHRPVFSVF